MKSFLEEYGFAILIAIVIITLIVMTSPIGGIIKTSVLGLADDFGNRTVAKIDKTEANLFLNGSTLTIESPSETNKYVAILRGYQNGKEVSVASVNDKLTCTDGMNNTATFAGARGAAETTGGLAKFTIENGNKLDKNSKYYIEIMNVGTGEIFKSDIMTTNQLVAGGGSDGSGGSGAPNPNPSNPYKAKVTSAQKLYDVGEASLTDDDIVTVNGIDCYVLQADGTKAELITKNMYDVRFDTGGHTAQETTHLGTGIYANKTYDYYYSTLRTRMDEFYRTQLGADSRILPTTVTYYTKDSYDSNLDTYATGTIADQYVFALDAKEAKQYKSKFSWNYENQMSGRGYGFWTTAGFRSGGSSGAWYVDFSGNFDYDYVDYFIIGARPAFWISLE